MATSGEEHSNSTTQKEETSESTDPSAVATADAENATAESGNKESNSAVAPSDSEKVDHSEDKEESGFKTADSQPSEDTGKSDIKTEESKPSQESAPSSDTQSPPASPKEIQDASAAAEAETESKTAQPQEDTKSTDKAGDTAAPDDPKTGDTAAPDDSKASDTAAPDDSPAQLDINSSQTTQDGKTDAKDVAAPASAASAAAAADAPAQLATSDASGVDFNGKYEHVRSEKLEEYLALNGVPWLLRKGLKKASPTLVIRQDGDNLNIKITTLVISKSMVFTVGQPFEETQFGNTYTVSSKWDGNRTIALNMEPKDTSKGVKPQKHTRHLAEDNTFTMTMEVGDVTCVRVFKKAVKST